MKAKKDWLVTINQVVRYRQSNNGYVPEYKQIKVKDVDECTIESYLSGESIAAITDDCGVTYSTRNFISAEHCSANERKKNRQQVVANKEHSTMAFLDLDENGEVITRKWR
ncbi:hypothetical protein LMB49_10735 [Limosilactobacillus reuteri]|uniref:hypothetical protein n=1 Tax=Limosilactobacillus reuteri TaxID=1598 RepID=UPI001E356CEC|nr:hypothetical protein [Limosilactobacillus reuteri]MCC4370563.1 hypothetical protein [Limosilactobacillus reuteri]MCC4371868.1 hypothetical protein [Limosilactobacillus reuteri]MCC4509339.1 hypothetical protein [Limosilactobacillus reuteri]MCC4509382.1 hypothetical protein [Limosilactobacillus reuteri]